LLRQVSEREEEQAPREREERVIEAFQRLARFAARSLGPEEMGPVPLADALTLIKFLKGGAW